MVAVLLFTLGLRWHYRSGWLRPLPQVLRAAKDANCRIDLNTATAAQLCWLPGVGPRYAQAIVQYRSQHGPLTSIDELTNIPRIGQGLVDRIRAFVIIHPPQETAPNDSPTPGTDAPDR